MVFVANLLRGAMGVQGAWRAKLARREAARLAALANQEHVLPPDLDMEGFAFTCAAFKDLFTRSIPLFLTAAVLFFLALLRYALNKVIQRTVWDLQKEMEPGSLLLSFISDSASSHGIVQSSPFMHLRRRLGWRLGHHKVLEKHFARKIKRKTQVKSALSHTNMVRDRYVDDSLRRDGAYRTGVAHFGRAV